MKTKSMAIGYVRVSRAGGRGGDSFLSPELQRQSIDRVCQREGLTLIDTLEELAKRRPASEAPGSVHVQGDETVAKRYERCLERGLGEWCASAGVRDARAR